MASSASTGVETATTIPPQNPSIRQRVNDFCTFLYNGDEGTVLGRTGKSWGKFLNALIFRLNKGILSFAFQRSQKKPNSSLIPALDCDRFCHYFDNLIYISNSVEDILSKPV